MKKLSLLIALGIACSIAIAKPTVNVSQFETYSQQMQDMSAKYISEKKFDNANKTIEAWLNSYNLLSDKEKASYAPVYATIMYNKACALTQKNEMFYALKALKEAVKAGFNNSTQAQNDPNLAQLKSYDEFNKILKSIKA
jgi:hypothetical protein